jgi:hypothetical protein
MRSGSSRVRNLVLLILCAGVTALGLVNWQIMDLEPAAPVTVASSADIPEASVFRQQPIDPLPLSEFEEIVRRPVFTASRSPFVVPTERAQTLAELRSPDIRLVGVAIDTNTKRALLRTAQQPQARWVEQGESIDGWLLQIVRQDAVTIASGQQVHELRLYPAQVPSSRQQ